MKKIIFKNIHFNNFKINEFDDIIRMKRLFVFPSGLGLASIDEYDSYYNSLKKADYVFLIVVYLYYY